MSVATVDRVAEVSAAGPVIGHRSTYRVRRWLPRRGTACRVGLGGVELWRVGAAAAPAAAPVAVARSRALRARLTAAALAFDVVCLGGLAVLVWSVVAGLQPVLQMTPLV